MRQDAVIRKLEIVGEAVKRISETTSNGGSWARWRSDGAELIYVAPGRLVMSVAVNSGERFTARPPTTLFRSRSGIGDAIGIVDPFEVSLDGQRFLMLVSPPAPTSIPLILNSPALLKP